MKILSFDLEHSPKPIMRPTDEGFYISCIGMVKWEDGEVVDKEVIWVEHSSKPNTSPNYQKEVIPVRKAIEWADTLVAHNLKHDMTILRNYGISFENKRLWCTMLVEYLLSGQDTRNLSVDLGSVAKRHGLPGKLDKVKVLWDQGVDTYDIQDSLLEEYVLDDCDKALQIYLGQVPMVEAWGLGKVVDLQNEFTFALSDMELYGFKFDVDKAENMAASYYSRMVELEQQVKDIVGIPELNVGSPKQISAVLFGGILKVDREEWVMRSFKTKPYTEYKPVMRTTEIEMVGLGFDPPTHKRNKDNSVPVDKDTIKQLRCRTPEQKIVKSALTEYGKLKKAATSLKGTDGKKGLVTKVGTDGNVHPSLNQTVTVTGRLSSSNPNSQNLPRGSTSDLKKCIIPVFDEIMQVDLSQIEWRCAAQLSRDRTMIHEINSGIDQHTEALTSPDLMNMSFSKEGRTNAKIFNFRMIYGGSAYGFYKDTKMPNFPLKRWEQIVNGFIKKYSGLADWWYSSFTGVMHEGSMQLPTGRRFVFNKQGTDYSEREVKNYPVQGMAGGDILPLMTVIIRRGMQKLGLKSRMILTVHDSVVFDVVKAERDVLIDLIGKVIGNLESYIERYFGFKWFVNLAGEIESGPTYGDLSFVTDV